MAPSPSRGAVRSPRAASVTAGSLVAAVLLVASSASAQSDDGVLVMEDGSSSGTRSIAAVEREGLTVIDLSDAWAPRVLRDEPSLGEVGRVGYRATYVALANERFDEVDEPDLARADRYLELFGIPPSFAVLRERLADEARHRCHDAIDDAPLEALEHDLVAGRNLERDRRNRDTARWLRVRLERERARRELADLDALSDDPVWGARVRQLRRLEERVGRLRATQEHLRCDGLLPPRAEDGVFDLRTGAALSTWQRRHAIVTGGARVDAETRAGLSMDTRELDFRAVLRALRERVADAAGILADGTASGRPGRVLGRTLDLDPELFATAEREPLANGAPDRVSAATEAAARALGWIDPAATLRSMTSMPPRVAVRLPPPAFARGEIVELRVRLERGDVWYDFPYDAAGRRRYQPVEHRPTLVVYAMRGGREEALVRWSTTIGGWQPERTPSGSVGLRYKESDVGPRVWRDLIAAPAWFPPPSTPDDDLVRRRGGQWVLSRRLFGPGYASAYGMVMLVHHEPRERREETVMVDHGIRAHGSVRYRSILRGQSHGCHRLFNHLALRMAGFLLAHRHYVPEGDLPTRYVRRVHHRGRSFRFTLESRGFGRRLEPPVPVEVTEGRIRGRVREAPRGLRPLPEVLAARAAAEAEGE